MLIRYLLSLALVALVIACDDDATEDKPGPMIDQNTVDARVVDGSTDADVGPPVVDGTVDMGPDARIPHMPSELPTEGEANQEGAAELTAPVAEGQARAGRVDTEDERLRGPEANCRVGDFRLDNSRVNICIQAETTFSQFSFAGGNIIDAHGADRPGTDTLREIVIAPGIGEISVDSIGIVRDGSAGGPAIIRTVGQADGALIIQGVLPNAFLPPPMQVTTEYRLAPDSNAVEILSWAELSEDTSAHLRLLDLVYFGDLNRDFKPGYGPETNAQPLEYVAAIGPDNTYGWFAEQATFTLFVLATVGVPGAPVEYEPVVIRTGDIFLFKRWLRIGTDVESIRPRPDGAQPVNISGEPGTEVIIEDPEEHLITQVKLDGDGQGVVHLVDGPYNAHTHAHAGGDTDQPFTVAGAAIDVTLVQPVPAQLRVSITDGDGQPIAARVELEGPSSILRFVVDEEVIPLPAGMWAVNVTRGWHFSAGNEAIELQAGESGELQFQLTEQIPLEGMASGEFHQHASPSLDSEVPVTDRVLSNVVEGVSFMVPSDHDIIYDYAALVARMGLSERVGTPLTGEEISPLYTHIGAYGMTYDPYAGAGGAVRIPVKDGAEWRVHTVPELIEQARDRGARVIQINHPRASQGYFDHVNYHATTPTDALDSVEFSTDFDSLEVYNGGSDFCQVLQDWMGLLNQGLRKTAVGNSDTHGRDRAPGYPRNYLPSLAPDPVGVTADEIVAALTNGRLTVGGDAMMDFPGDVTPGDTIETMAETVDIRVRVRTPDDISVNRLVVFVNGVPIADRAIESAIEDIVDMDEAVTVPIQGDAHVIFLALGGERADTGRPSRNIFAFSNPIWVDRDGGGITPLGPTEIPKMDLPFCN